MNYLSLTFAAFVAVLFILYYVVPKKTRGIILLLGSLAFYACYDLRYLLFLLFVAASTFFAALGINRLRRKRLVMLLCIGANAALWFVIKELPWALYTAERLLSVLGVDAALPGLNMLVPVGISYYTLQAIAYLADAAKGKIQPETKFWKYLLFLSWFPAVVQGPISRYDRLMPQLLNDRKYSFDAMRRSLILILFGLVKKMVLADRLAIFVNYCFANQAELQGVILYIGAVFYSIQLYADFSGCVDICRGVSGLFGVDMVQNFRAPYLSGSIKEFWNRWHMSLSGWLRDYIYIPLGGNRKGTARKYINIAVTFFVSGIWHGAGFNFLVWGLLHAAYQIVGDVTANDRARVKRLIGVREGSVSERIYKIVITFNLVAFAWIFFRSDGLMGGMEYVRNMVARPELWVLFDGSLYTHGVSQNHFILLAVHICVLLFVELRYPIQDDAAEGLMQLHLILRWVIYLMLIFDVLLFGVYGSGYSLSGFLYGGF